MLDDLRLFAVIAAAVFIGMTVHTLAVPPRRDAPALPSPPADLSAVTDVLEKINVSLDDISIKRA